MKVENSFVVYCIDWPTLSARRKFMIAGSAISDFFLSAQQSTVWMSSSTIASLPRNEVGSCDFAADFGDFAFARVLSPLPSYPAACPYLRSSASSCRFRRPSPPRSPEPSREPTSTPPLPANPDDRKVSEGAKLLRVFFPRSSPAQP